MIKGYLFKYAADPEDNELKDKVGTVCYGCKIGLRDPDFWENKIPVWSICGPYVRTSLVKGDIVFFIPKKKPTLKAGLRSYMCSGILVVEDKIIKSNEVMLDNRLTQMYKKRYKFDLYEHLKRDKPRTKKIRSKNIIIGSKSKSRWFGKNYKYLDQILGKLGYNKLATKLKQRKLPKLSEKQVKELYNELIINPTI